LLLPAVHLLGYGARQREFQLGGSAAMNLECCEAVRAAVETLRKHEIYLDKIRSSVCSECGGSGEVGLSDGEVVCPFCFGSGDPLRPGIWKPKDKSIHK
jgi:hypothetical protein